MKFPIKQQKCTSSVYNYSLFVLYFCFLYFIMRMMQEVINFILSWTKVETFHPFSLWDCCVFGFTTRRVWWQESAGSPPTRRGLKIFWRKFYTSAWTTDHLLITEQIQSPLNSEAHYILYVKLKIPNTSYTTVLIKVSDITRSQNHPVQNERFIA